MKFLNCWREIAEPGNESSDNWNQLLIDWFQVEEICSQDRRNSRRSIH